MKPQAEAVPTHADLRAKAAANAKIVSTALAVTMLLSLAIRMLMPRRLGVEALGGFYFSESYVLLFLLLMSPGIESYVMRSVPARPAHAREIMFTSALFQLIAALTLTTIMAASLVATGYPPSMVGLASIIALYTALTIHQTAVPRPIFLALDRYGFISKLEVLTKVVQVASVLTVLALSPDVMLVAMCFFVAEILETVVMYVAAWRSDLILFKVDFPRLGQILKTGFPFFLLGVCSQINASVDTTILEKLTSRSEVGFYGAAVRLKGVLLMMIPVLGNAFMPLLSKTLKESPEMFAGLARDILRTVLVLAFPATLGLIVFAPEIVGILFGEAFSPSARVLVVVAPLVGLTYMNYFLSSLLQLSTAGKVLTLVSALGLALNAGLCFAFIPAFRSAIPSGGAGVGAALATLVSESCIALGLLGFATHKILDRRMIGLLLATVLPLGGTIVLFVSHDATLSTRIAMFALATPIYMLMTRMTSPNELKSFFQLVTSRRPRPS